MVDMPRQILALTKLWRTELQIRSPGWALVRQRRDDQAWRVPQVLERVPAGFMPLCSSGYLAKCLTDKTAHRMLAIVCFTMQVSDARVPSDLSQEAIELHAAQFQHTSSLNFLRK